MTHYESVIEFMELMGQPILLDPTEPTTKLGLLRINLIKEEIQELNTAFDNDDYIEIADALADILYVAYGAYGSFGLCPSKHNCHTSGHVLPDAHLLPMSQAHSAITTLTRFVNDLHESLARGKLSASAGALDSIIKETYRIAFISGIDIDACFKEVHNSNMSKACLTKSDAEASLRHRREDPATASKYHDAEVHQVGDRFILRRSGDGKVLKGIHYFEPNLAQYLTL